MIVTTANLWESFDGKFVVAMEKTRKGCVDSYAVFVSTNGDKVTVCENVKGYLAVAHYRSEIAKCEQIGATGVNVGKNL